MKLSRMFTTDRYKGTRGYLDSQRAYEVMRTVLYFAVSLSLFFGGWAATGNRMNLLTVVAVLGCLPASKSAVEAIMYFRFHSCRGEDADRIEDRLGELKGVFDMAFTSYEKNYQVDHLTVKGNTVCGYSSAEKFDEQGFYKHIEGILKAENYRDTSVKIFREIGKYTDRLDTLRTLEADEACTEGIIRTLKSVAL